jgi:hypothetical protein
LCCIAIKSTDDDAKGPLPVSKGYFSSHRKLLWSKATVVNVAEKPEQDSGRHD